MRGCTEVALLNGMISKQSLFLVVVFHSLVIILTLLYAKAHWRFSPFFELQNAQIRVNEIVGYWSSRIGELPDARQPDPASSFCVAIQSIDRIFPYLWVTLGSLLMQPFCHLPPVRLFRPEGHNAYLEPILSKVPVRRLNTSMETVSYADVLSGCLDAGKPYTLVLEDDVWVTSRLEKEIIDLIEILEDRKMVDRLCYIKLFSPSLVDWGHDLWGYVLLLGLPYAGLLRLVDRGRPWPWGLRLALALGFVAGELFIIGRNDFKSKLPFRRYFQKGRAMSALAMLYPQAAIPQLGLCLTHPELFNGGPDEENYHLTDNWLHHCCGALGLTPYNSLPHLVQHVGASSSRTGGWYLYQTAYFYP